MGSAAPSTAASYRDQRAMGTKGCNPRMTLTLTDTSIDSGQTSLFAVLANPIGEVIVVLGRYTEQRIATNSPRTLHCHMSPSAKLLSRTAFLLLAAMPTGCASRRPNIIRLTSVNETIVAKVSSAAEPESIRLTSLIAITEATGMATKPMR